MEYFTFKVKSPTGETIFETDFTFKEFLPQISLTLKDLGAYTYLTELLQNCKIIITPHYEGTPKSEVFLLPQTDFLPQQGNDEVLRISLDEIPEKPYKPPLYTLDPYKYEQSCYSCEGCPMKDWCPEQGEVKLSELHQKISLDPEAPLSNESVRYFTIRVESDQGERLYQQDFSGQILNDFGVRVFQHLLDRGQLPLKFSKGYRVEIVVHREGTPQINPVLSSQPKLRAYRVVLHAMPENSITEPEQAPPGMMVNWDQVEAASEQEELDITFISTEENSLDSKAMSELEEVHTVGTVSKKDLPIFIKQSVIDTLKNSTQVADTKQDGVLIGNAYLDTTDNRPFVEILGIVSKPAEPVAPIGFTLDYPLWRLVEKHLSEEFPGSQSIGWYRIKKLYTSSGYMYTTGDYDVIYAPKRSRAFLLSEEEFVHKTFFQENWQIGLLVDSEKGKLHFFQWQGKELVECSGYYIIN